MAFRLANWRPALLLMLGLFVLSGPNRAVSADGPGRPAMTIIMERSELLAAQTLGLTVWIDNPTDSRVTDIRFDYAGPSFLNIGKFAPDNKTCNVVKRDTGINLGSIEPNSALDPSKRLCLQAELEVDERDVSLGFSVTYKLTKDGKSTSGFLVAEKKLSVGLFGTESVGGVSLRLAAFVVPGLLFMMILRLGGFPGLEKLGGGADVATLSVLVSVVLFLLAGFIPRVDFAFAGIGSSVSAALFVTLCLLAFAISLVMVGIHRALLARSERQRRALLVEVTDNDATVLQKALRGAKADFRPVTVITRDQKKFVGSLMAPTSSGGVALVGWFKLELPASDARRQQLGPLIEQRQLLAALDLARQQSIEPKMENPVRTLSADGDLEDTEHTIRRFLHRDVQESSLGDVPKLEPALPLVLKTR